MAKYIVPGINPNTVALAHAILRVHPANSDARILAKTIVDLADDLDLLRSDIARNEGVDEGDITTFTEPL